MEYVSWLWESWWGYGRAPWIGLVLALVAVVCGTLVGAERQRREKPAGLRTLTLVCLGSAVFTMTSFAFTTTTGDSGRVAAQIVTGIGFLGAGAILHGRHVISGMTTAALIWMTAAIGMAVGAGYVGAGLGLSILVNRLLVGIFIYETRWHPDLQSVCVVVEFKPNKGMTQIRLERIMADYDIVGVMPDWEDASSGSVSRLTLRLRMARVHLHELLAEIVDVPDVVSVKQTSCP